MTGPHRLLTIEDLVAIATRIGRGDPHVRDLGLLESAAARPGTSVFGEDAYPDLVGQHVKFVYKHNKPEVTVRFGSSLAKDNCKATWGINNFMLYVR